MNGTDLAPPSCPDPGEASQVTVCCGCGRVRGTGDRWGGVVRSEESASMLSHGICHACLLRLYPAYARLLEPERPPERK